MDSPYGFKSRFSHQKPLILSGFIICGYGGTGRRAGFRFQWATMQVQVLLSAPKRRLQKQSSFFVNISLKIKFLFSGCQTSIRCRQSLFSYHFGVQNFSAYWKSSTESSVFCALFLPLPIPLRILSWILPCLTIPFPALLFFRIPQFLFPS